MALRAPDSPRQTAQTPVRLRDSRTALRAADSPPQTVRTPVRLRDSRTASGAADSPQQIARTPVRLRDSRTASGAAGSPPQTVRTPVRLRDSRTASGAAGSPQQTVRTARIGGRVSTTAGKEGKIAATYVIDSARTSRASLGCRAGSAALMLNRLGNWTTRTGTMVIMASSDCHQKPPARAMSATRGMCTRGPAPETRSALTQRPHEPVATQQQLPRPARSSPRAHRLRIRARREHKGDTRAEARDEGSGTRHPSAAQHTAPLARRRRPHREHRALGGCAVNAHRLSGGSPKGQVRG